MIKVFILIILLTIVTINFILTKKAFKLFTFYLQVIPKNPYIKLAKEIQVGQKFDIELLKIAKNSLSSNLTIVAISVECSKCKELINSFSQSNHSFSDLIFLSNGKIPEIQKNILINENINFIESDKVFKMLGVRSVPKAIKVEDKIILSVNSVSNVSDLILI